MIKEGAYADIIVTDYDPYTPMTASNINSHVLFGMQGRSVVTTMINGKVVYKDREFVHVDEKAMMAKIREVSEKYWNRINA